MPINPDQCDIRSVRPGVWKVESDYNPDFVDYMKSRVPADDRSYDPDTHIWEIRGDNYIPMLESIAVQKFSFATRIYTDSQGRRVWRNLKSGREEVQENLFGT
jgi:hypothetical protein